MRLTPANGLTAARLLAIGPSVWAIAAERWEIAGILFTLSVLTDMLDGPLARRLGQASAAGGLFDHLTDALYVAACLAALAAAGYLNVWLPGLVLLAFVQYLLDSRALAGAELRTSLLGRYNGIAYFVLVGIPVLREALGLSWPADVWIASLGWLLLASTLISMADRALALIRRYR